MPQYCEVVTLQSLSLSSIGKLVTKLASIFIKKLHNGSYPDFNLEYEKALSEIKELLNVYVPYHLYDSVAVNVCVAIRNLITNTKATYSSLRNSSLYLNDISIIINLIQLVLTKHLKEIDFRMWPILTHCILFNNMHKLTGLEVLNLGSCEGTLHTSDNEALVEGITIMKNLRSFSLRFKCGDDIIEALGNNCRNLQVVDVVSSQHVTDRSIADLLKCQHLTKVQVYRTSISENGLVQLVVGLKNLKDFGRCDKFGNIIKYIYENRLVNGNLCLKKFETCYLSSDCLESLLIICSKVQYISLFHDTNITDFSILESLCSVREFQLSSCAFYTNSFKEFLYARGSMLSSLHLEHVEELDLNSLVIIGQCCPLLSKFVLYNGIFVDQIQSDYPKLKERPYQHLEYLFWVADFSENHLKFVLSHAFNIKFVYIGSSINISHATMVQLLEMNQMEKLEELRIMFSPDMSMSTVKQLLDSCPKLKVLVDLRDWSGITCKELNSFGKYLHLNNYNLNLNPTSL